MEGLGAVGRDGPGEWGSGVIAHLWAGKVRQRGEVSTDWSENHPDREHCTCDSSSKYTDPAAGKTKTRVVKGICICPGSG